MERTRSIRISIEIPIGSCLTIFDYPEGEWLSLMTTNAIEGLNKEFKRRTKSMDIVADENTCYRLMAFIALKMEVHWRSTPVGKGGKTSHFSIR